MHICFTLEGEMEQYAQDIHIFVGLMLKKLHANIHKGRWENQNIEDTYQNLVDEVVELNDAIEDNDAEGILMEAADVANFAMIVASIQQERPNG